MSYQLDQERGIKTQIAMPELPPEPVEQEVTEEITQEQAGFAQATAAAPDNAETSEVQEPVNQSPSSQHFKAVKQLKEKAERERDEAVRRAAELEARYAQQQPQQPVEDYNVDIGNDDLAEGKHLHKINKRVDNKIKELEEKIARYESAASTTMVEQRLRLQYPDIDKVVTKENIEILAMQEPDIAATIDASPDMYRKAVTAYKLIKKLGIQPEDNFEQDRTRAKVNAAKPRPLTSVNPQQGDSPLSHANAFANGLTDELKASLLKEMMTSRR